MMRKAKLRSLAKLNLDLRVLNKRADGFHELRTVFHTISLADSIAVEFETARRTSVEIDTVADGRVVNIPNNLVERAALAVLDAIEVKANVRFRLEKNIPMGGGLGGGSSNAAAVLLALPVLAGKNPPFETLLELGAVLGSDVPFFLEGGAALGVDRGTEIYGLSDPAEEPIFVVVSGIHVATGPAYQALARGPADGSASKLTSLALSRSINSFQRFVRTLGEMRSAKAASAFSANDFEPVVFGQHPQLKLLAARLRKSAGREAAAGVRMTGSGSALFAIFGSNAERDVVLKSFERSLKRDPVFGECRVIPASLVSRRGYRRMWRRQLAGHVVSGDSIWPLQSRHAR